jgi:hypothetical protein
MKIAPSFEGKKIRVPLSCFVQGLDFVLQDRGDGYTLTFQGVPITIEAIAGGAHYVTYKTPFVVSGSIFVPKGKFQISKKELELPYSDEGFLKFCCDDVMADAYKKLPHGYVLIQAPSYVRVVFGGFVTLFVKNGVATPVYDEDYDTTINYYKFTAPFKAKVIWEPPTNSIVLRWGDTATKVKGVGLIVALTLKNGYVKFKTISYSSPTKIFQQNSLIMRDDGRIEKVI